MLINRYLIQKSSALLFILAGASWSGTILAQNGWERMEDMNKERIFHGSCLLENSIYVFGSNTPLVPDLASVEVYDISANEWATLANMPKPIGDPHVCGINKMIYLIGGWYNESDNQNASNFNLEYNPEQDGYTERKNCPFPTASSPSCVLNNKIHVFGNRETVTNPWLPQKNVFVYDPVADNWDSLPDMNFEHTDGDAVTLNNKIYLMGGAIEIIRDTAFFFVEGKSEMYDPETNSWTILKDMPVPVARHASVAHDNKILVFGGDSADYFWGTFHGTDLIQEYDPSTDTWRIMEGMPFNRFASTAHKAGDFVYIIGGEDRPNHRLKEVWRFDLNYLKPTTSTNELIHGISPLFTLRQNYPNPFCGCTQISYEMAEPGVVDLDIVNGFGQEIITLDHGMKSPGSYSVTWDAKGIGSGFYFCRLRVGEAEKVMKLIVLP